MTLVDQGLGNHRNAVEADDTSLPGERQRSQRRLATIRKLLRQKASFVGFILCCGVILCAVFAPFLAPYDPLKIDPMVILNPPSRAHLLGTG